MGIDNSIYNVAAPDFLGGFQKGQQISNARADQKRQEQEYLAQQQAAQQKALAEQKQKEVQLLARSGRGVKDQAGYDSLLKTAKFMGHDISQLPPQWGADAQGMIASLASNELGVDKQIGIETDAKQFDYTKTKDNRTFANADRAFNLDKTEKNRNYDLALTKEGLSREMFQSEDAYKNAVLAKGEKELMQREKAAQDLQKYRDAKLAGAQTKSQGKTAELSVAEAKQLGLYKSGMLANQQYEDAMAKGDYDPTSYMALIDNNSYAPQGMKGASAQAAQSAEEAWVESFLRDASGAAIPASERAPYKDQFFARKGDSPEVLKNKAALRAQKMENARVGSGVDGAPQTMQAQQPRQQLIPDANALNQLPDDELMKMYKQMGGQ